tara:strand:- start:382 stop:831 length:450 start_codon:yes stop_codon:yes gene_type:complete
MSPLKKEDKKLEIQKLLDQIESEKEAKIRAIADLENVRRREAENKKHWSTQSVAGFWKPFLPSLLALQLGMAHATDKDVKQVIEKFFADLHTAGLKKIDPKPGEKIDPTLHEVLCVAQAPAGEIVQTLEPGWRFEDIVLAPAKVSAGSH